MQALKIRYKNTTRGAVFRALVAVRTFFVINDRKVINDLNSARLAVLFAYTASDTSDGAVGASHRALIH